MGKLSVTYKLECGPSPVDVDEYADSTNRAYETLLSSSLSEGDVQSFLEKHPWLVPGSLTSSGASGHYPLYCSLIAQPKLPGHDVKIPDFMWIAKHSGAWYPTLIEIEEPGKRLFNQDGTTSAKFTRARNQLEQWRAWFNKSENVQMFLSYYGIPQSIRNLTMKLHMILVYGRRSEFESKPKLASHRGSLLSGQDEELVSFDRLTPIEAMRNAITVKAMGSGRFRARWIPSTFRLGPNVPAEILDFEGISEAIDSNPEIEGRRREFLKRRLGYWKRWEASESLKMRNSGDWE